MIRAWLDMSPAGIFLSLIVLNFGMVLLLATLAFRSPLVRPLQSLNGVVAPFFNAVAILFALLVGFLANDVSDRGRQALRTVQAEAGELRNIHTLSIASASDMHSIRIALKAYISAVVTDEWPAMDALRPSPSTATAYDELLREVSQPSLSRASGQAAHAALLNATVRAGTARNVRLSLASDHTNDLKWLVVIALGLFTQVAIGLVHLEKPRAFVASLVVFAGAVVMTLGIIALQEYPFEGAFQVSPAPIAALQSLSD
ncbi:MAG: hypothetical protein BGP05_01365 [Rhizobiales bacterium 62-47]|nr:DUF4239 domain-containing protein [Hyphomicrobiales bacterium]OJY12032.1 MAG: hypothetical protein BGP05_01365 [Rhizobiales bacterium 62-47]